MILRRGLIWLWILGWFYSFPVSAQNKPIPGIHIYFRFNSFEIDTNQYKTLNTLASTLSHSTKEFRLMILGNCDSVSSDSYNDTLSLHRAEAVKNYLVKKGISPAKMFVIKGYGKRKPANANKTEEERQMNRRVDIIVQYSLKKITPEHVKRSVPSGKISQLDSDSAKAGTHIVLRNLNFYGGMHHLLPGSLPTLDTLVKILKANPNLKICILGYVCCTENGEDGMDNETRTFGLSWNRAKEVYLYLIKNRISKDRLTYKGMGGQNHIADPEITEEDKTTNRRVEIVVVER